MQLPQKKKARMKRGRGGWDDFFGFGDPFAGFGGHGICVVNIFGGKEQAPQSRKSSKSSKSSKSKGPIIRELSDDDDDNVEEERDEDIEVKKNPKKHSRLSKEPYVQDPDEEAKGKKMKHTDYRTVYDLQAHTFSVSSNFVSFGGPDGLYYTASTTRMCGGDGVTIEESKEVDAIARKAAHRLSRGLRDKGHSVTRRLNSDGRVDTMQTLYNLNQDELPNFNEAWNRSAREHLPGWNQGFDIIDNGDITGGSSRQNEQPSSTEQPSTNSAWATPQFRTYL
ncbi:hypothetical protein J5N97_025531 [Dioscorea zingiberensis]|uniref:Uncharacterized protein n=1 Tax=Dioscorea zingiberensis TaxID=325984 RepID=A0A9D5H9Q7_9LILI|nr:hypothetical protein J5N97_025531 [Dioscorea zingiberensis]